MQNNELNAVYKVARWVLAALGVFLVFLIMGQVKSLREVSPGYNAITVSGQGEASAVPDVATFSFAVSADAKTVADAQASVTASTDALLKALAGLGIAEKDIKTADYSVYPKYEYQGVSCSANMICPPGKQVQTGFTVTHSLTVKVRDAAKIGEALAAAGDNGATNISGVSFTFDNPDRLEDDARAAAIADAKAKADKLAKDLGVSLVRVVSFSENGSGNPVPVAMEYRAADGKGGGEPSPTIPTGENKVASNVQVTYEIR
jgi:uncharacterized protein YggE